MSDSVAGRGPGPAPSGRKPSGAGKALAQLGGVVGSTLSNGKTSGEAGGITG